MDAGMAGLLRAKHVVQESQIDVASVQPLDNAVGGHGLRLAAHAPKREVLDASLGFASNTVAALG